MKQRLVYGMACILFSAAGTALGQTDANYAIDLNGTTDHITSNAALAVANDFTMEAWVRPTTPHEVDAESGDGCKSGVSGQHYAVYPLHGTAVWGTGHAGIGLSVGTNGVSVYEHAAEHMPAVLVYTAPIAGWTHVAVTYRDRIPSLYINGKLVRTGTRSRMTYVHPSAGRVPDRYVYGGIGGGPFGYFAGALDDFRVWNRACSAREINTSMRKLDYKSGEGLVVAYDMNRSGEGAGLSVPGTGMVAGTTAGTTATPRFVATEIAGTQSGAGERPMRLD